MATRQELKAELYAVFYEAEKGINAKPDIRPTSDYIKKSKTVIPFVAASRLFPERAGFRQFKALVAIMFCTVITAILLFDPGQSFILRIILSTICAVMVFGITIEQVNKINPAGESIEISSEGIELKGQNLTWNQIMGTYIVMRRGNMRLVLLLDSGEILKQNLERYGKFSFLKGKQIAELCHYIEYFKNKVPGW